VSLCEFKEEQALNLTSNKQNSYKPPEQTMSNKESCWQEIATE